MTQQKGYLIALEGTDKVGKSTQRAKIGKFYEDAGFRVHYTREPGGTPAGEKLREFLFAERKDGQEISDIAELLLFFAARDIHINQLIKPLLADGWIVITDRYVDSSYAYQIAGGGAPVELINMLDKHVVGEVVPDMTFLLTADVNTKLQRAEGSTRDAMELKGSDYYARAEQAYLDLALSEPDRYRVIDANVDVEQVFAQILPTLGEIDRDLRKRPTMTIDSLMAEGAHADIEPGRAMDPVKPIPTENCPDLWLAGGVEVLPGFIIAPQVGTAIQEGAPAGHLFVEYTEGLNFMNAVVPFWVETTWNTAQLYSLNTEVSANVIRNMLMAMTNKPDVLVDVMVVVDNFATNFGTHHLRKGSRYPAERWFDLPEPSRSLDAIIPARIGEAVRGCAAISTPIDEHPLQRLEGIDRSVSIRTLNDGRIELHVVIDANDQRPYDTVQSIAEFMLPRSRGFVADEKGE